MSIQIAGCQGTEALDTAVAEEGPPAVHLFAAREVDVDEQQAVGLVAFGQKLALRAANETMAPELYIGTLPI